MAIRAAGGLQADKCSALPAACCALLRFEEPASHSRLALLLLSLWLESRDVMASLTPAAAEGLVASLQRAAAELEWISYKLEDEFSRSCRKGEINTLSLLNRINKLSR